MKLIPGAHYYAGLDLPWFVSQATVTKKLKEQGFPSPQWHEPEESPPINPRLDPAFRPDYPEWVDGVYQGAERDIEIPITPHWLVVIPPQGAPRPIAASPVAMTPTTSPAGAIEKSSSASVTPLLLVGAGVALDVLFFGYVFKKVASRKNSEKKGSSMSPLLLTALAAGGVVLYVSSKKGQPNWQKPTAAEINARYQVAMAMPTLDPNMWSREIAYFQGIGEAAKADALAARWNELRANNS